MGLFSAIGGFIDSVCNIIVAVIGGLIATAIFAVGAVLELAIDILSWIKSGIDELLDDGSTEVNIIKGSAIADFIRVNQAQGNYTEITFEQLQAMDTGAVNVANNDQEIQKMQMFRSEKGFSEKSQAQFGVRMY